jgi:hypothetical protein
MMASKQKDERMKKPATKFEPLEFQKKSPEEMLAISESFYLE